MIGMTLCSGIGAPEMAAPWVDWRLASEVENFPRAVLQERFKYTTPEDQNQGDRLLWGDMTKITPALLRNHGLPLPNLIVAGTPCQSFSIAGLRAGVEDERGSLTLKFVEICHAMVDARHDGKLAILWENVPGILSDKGNAFGCFLAGIIGADNPLPPPDGERWPSAGMVSGPRARAAWRVLDAQYFGVAQRRRRVFAVIDFGGYIDPAAVLFERKSLHGNTPPSREKGQVVAPSLTASAGGCSGKDPHEGRMIAFCQNSRDEVRYQGGDGQICGALAAQPGVKQTTYLAFSSKDHGADAIENLSPTIRSGGHKTSHANAGAPPAIAIQERAVSANTDNGPAGIGIRADDCSFTLESRRTSQAVAFSIMPMNSGRDFKARSTDVAQPLMAGGPVGGNQGGDYVQSHMTVRRLTPIECARLQGFPDNHTAINYRGKPAADGPQYKAMGNSMAVPVIAWIMNRMRQSVEDMKK